jgi:hypothetical protein
MPITPLPAHVILEDFPAETNDNFILSPDKKNVDCLWLFMRQGDVDHICFLLNELAPVFKEDKVIPKSGNIGGIIASANHYTELFAVIPPNEAKQYFETEYPEYMAQYFGMDNAN